MNSYLTRLNALDFRHSLLGTAARARLVLLTGQSSFASSRLSVEQTDFLRHVAPPATDITLAGFPFHPEFDRAASEPLLLSASLRNGRQFLWSLRNPVFQNIVARALQPAMQNTMENLFLITGSCGLQMLACAWPKLAKPEHLRVHIVALGPTLFRPFTLKPADINVIQGRRDWISRACYRGTVAAYCATGHLDYWQSPETRALVAQSLAQCNRLNHDDDGRLPSPKRVLGMGQDR